MGTTTNYGIPYPECDRPLRADASDIADFRDLAVAVDSALDVVYEQGRNDVFAPDTVRLATGAAVAGLGQNFNPFFNINSFSNNLGMVDTTNGVIRIVEPGRYWVGGYCAVTALGMASPRLRFLLNGAAVSNFQTPGIIIDASTATCQTSVMLTITQENAALGMQVRHSASAALAYTSTARIWALQLQRF